LHAISIDRTDNALDNMVEHTKLVAYGLVKAQKEKTCVVPFPRTAPTREK